MKIGGASLGGRRHSDPPLRVPRDEITIAALVDFMDHRHGIPMFNYQF